MAPRLVNKLAAYGEGRRVRNERFFELSLGAVAPLEPFAVDQLDAVVRVGIVACRDRNPTIGSQLASQIGDAGGGDDSGPANSSAHLGEARAQPSVNRLGAGAGVAADDNDRLGARLLEALPQLSGELGQGSPVDRWLTEDAPDTVGSEQLHD